MIFAPYKNGVSHSPWEEITAKQASQGCQVLFDTLLSLTGKNSFLLTSRAAFGFSPQVSR
ncbi:hypothetical protein X474_03605 [Dethiosulfatarculus sandiegensis]|uniref:Uncharacterized protein n=1 Tax=Dethiosulfatarculus sandiegensis TaxID=1429043 RepID=A0A0D2JBA3_9BACT|nr:hypothetical protein X474_03605 [Dethiosulfatarculus sandiegensis]